MRYSLIPFECKECGKKLNAKLEFVPGVGMGGQQAECPSCGLIQGDFPMKVTEVLVRD